MFKLGIDLDGVLCDFTAGFYAVAEKLYPGRIPKDHIQRCWNFSDTGLTPGEVDSVWRAVMHTSNFWLNLPPYEDNVAALAHLMNTRWTDIEIVYLTSRVPTLGLSVAQQSDLWLGRHRLMRPGCCVIVKPANWPKAAIYSILDVPLSIDDYLGNVNQTVPGHQAFLLDRPWNREGRNPETPVVASLDEFLTIAAPKEATVSA